MTEEVMRELYDITDRIADLESRQYEIAKERREISDRVGVIHAQTPVDAATEYDYGEDATRSNPELRQAIIALRLQENEEYQTLKKRLWELDDAERPLAIEHNRLVDQRTLRMLEMGWAGASSLGSA